MSEREDTVKGEHPLSSPISAPNSLGSFKESSNFKNLSAASSAKEFDWSLRSLPSDFLLS